MVSSAMLKMVERGRKKKYGIIDMEHYNHRCKELYDDFKTPHKKLGFIRQTTCKNCGGEITYLFLPAYRSGVCVSRSVNTGSKLHIAVVYEDARVVSDVDCPHCGKSLYWQLVKESSARVLR